MRFKIVTGKKKLSTIPCIVCLCVTLGISHRVYAQANASTLDSTKLAQESTFVFNGTVEKIEATTVPQAAASPRTVVVRVDSIQRCTTNVCGAVGKTVTVQLLAPGSVKNGEQATFFTQGWILGSGVAVTELSHVTPPLTDERVKNLLAEGNKAVTDEALKAQVTSAKCVITGEVQGVKAVTPTSSASGEHISSDWQDATVKVQSIEKTGCLPPGTATVHVVFPVSNDVAWVTAPKFQQGQKGIFILNSVPSAESKTFAAPGPRTYTSLGKNDFKSLDDISSVRSALK